MAKTNLYKIVFLLKKDIFKKIYIWNLFLYMEYDNYNDILAPNFFTMEF